jgi:hypothetical protein
MNYDKKKRTGICVYCGRRRRLTRDHIPPKNLFPKPLPVDLITVPSCTECNNEAAKDDEYFRMVVVMREDAGRHLEAQRAWGTVFRSLQRPEAVGLKTSLLRSLRPVSLRSPSGLYLGYKPGYTVDLDRLNRVATRIVKGLFFHERGYRLPDTHRAFGLVDPRLIPDEQGVKSTATVLAALQTQQARTVGNGVFSYKFLFTEDESDSSVWLMSFYENLFAIGVTLPQEEPITPFDLIDKPEINQCPTTSPPPAGSPPSKQRSTAEGKAQEQQCLNVIGPRHRASAWPSSPTIA